MANENLKNYARRNFVFLWEVAEKFGCNDANFSRKLRKPFTEDMKDKFVKAVDEIVAEREVESNED